jgi:hypothetical protein
MYKTMQMYNKFLAIGMNLQHMIEVGVFVCCASHRIRRSYRHRKSLPKHRFDLARMVSTYIEKTSV